MKNLVNTKKVLGLIAGAFFAFALLFNTSLATNENGAVSLSLAKLEIAQAQDWDGENPTSCWDIICDIEPGECFTINGVEHCTADERVCEAFEIDC